MTWRLRNPFFADKPLVPLPHQWELAHSQSRDTFLAGGWGSAKTAGGLLFCEQAAWENPGTIGLVVFPVYRLLRNFLNRYLRPAFKEIIKSEVKGDYEIHLVNGSTIVWISGHNLELIEAYTAAWAYVDEVGLFKRDVFERITARTRDPKAKRIRRAYTGTPHYGWLKDEFDKRDDADRKIIHASTRDNPYTPKEFKESLYLNCPARLRHAYIDGHFVPPGGSVYPEWDIGDNGDGRHVIDFAPDFSLPIVPVIDWSARTPHVLIAQLIPEGYVIPGRGTMAKLDPRHKYAAAVILDELIPDGTYQAYTIERMAQEVRALGYRFAGEFVCDPAGTAKEATSGTSAIQQFAEYMHLRPRFRLKAADRLIANGIDMVKRMLEPMDGIPRLYVSRYCYDKAEALQGNQATKHLAPRSLVYAMGAYSYPEIISGKAVKSDPVKDGITDHACDTLRYLVINYFNSTRLTVRRY